MTENKLGFLNKFCGVPNRTHPSAHLNWNRSLAPRVGCDHDSQAGRRLHRTKQSAKCSPILLRCYGRSYSKCFVIRMINEILIEKYRRFLIGYYPAAYCQGSKVIESRDRNATRSVNEWHCGR